MPDQSQIDKVLQAALDAGLTDLSQLVQLKEALEKRIDRAAEVKQSQIALLQDAFRNAVVKLSNRLSIHETIAVMLLKGGIMHHLCSGDYDVVDSYTDDGFLIFDKLSDSDAAKALAFVRCAA